MPFKVEGGDADLQRGRKVVLDVWMKRYKSLVIQLAMILGFASFNSPTCISAANIPKEDLARVNKVSLALFCTG